MLTIPWPISVTHAIITTGHPIFIICQNMLCYYQRDSSYYHMPHAIINTNHAIINKIYTIIIYPMLLLTIWCYYQPTLAGISKTHSISDNSYSDTSTTHIIIRHIILLSDTYVIFKQITLLSDNSLIIKHLILLSTPQLIILTFDIIPLLSLLQPLLIVIG